MNSLKDFKMTFYLGDTGEINLELFSVNPIGML